MRALLQIRYDDGRWLCDILGFNEDEYADTYANINFVDVTFDLDYDLLMKSDVSALLGVLVGETLGNLRPLMLHVDDLPGALDNERAEARKRNRINTGGGE